MVTSETRREYFKKYYAQNRKKYQDYAKAWWKAHPEKLAQKNHRKYLRHRGERLAKSAIWKKNNPDKVRGYWRNDKKAKQRSRDWYLKNREQQRSKAKAYYEANKTTILSDQREWAKQHPEIVKERSKRYSIKHKEKNAKRSREWHLKNRESQLIKFRKYAKENREQNMAYWHKRRALKRAATINLAGIKEWMKSVRSKPSAICYWCQSSIPKSKIHFDHIVALVKGGSHSLENLCVSCRDCNARKHAKSIRSFVQVGQQILEL